MTSGLKVQGLSAGYGGIKVLDGIDLEAPARQLTVVVGPNGAGKSTMLKAVAGLIPREGEVLFEDAPLPAEPAAIVARGVALVPEGRQLFPQMTVRENLESADTSRRAPSAPRGLKASSRSSRNSSSGVTSSPGP